MSSIITSGWADSTVEAVLATHTPYIVDPTNTASAIAVQFTKVDAWTRSITQVNQPIIDETNVFVSSGTWHGRSTKLSIYVPDQATSDAVVALLMLQKTLWLIRPQNDPNASAQAIYFAVVGDITEDHANPRVNSPDRLITCSIVEQAMP